MNLSKYPWHVWLYVTCLYIILVSIYIYIFKVSEKNAISALIKPTFMFSIRSGPHVGNRSAVRPGVRWSRWTSGPRSRSFSRTFTPQLNPPSQMSAVQHRPFAPLLAAGSLSGWSFWCSSHWLRLCTTPSSTSPPIRSTPASSMSRTIWSHPSSVTLTWSTNQEKATASERQIRQHASTVRLIF